jgi:hypothetical protein
VTVLALTTAGESAGHWPTFAVGGSLSPEPDPPFVGSSEPHEARQSVTARSIEVRTRMRIIMVMGRRRERTGSGMASR